MIEERTRIVRRRYIDHIDHTQYQIPENSSSLLDWFFSPCLGRLDPYKGVVFQGWEKNQPSISDLIKSKACVSINCRLLG